MSREKLIQASYSQVGRGIYVWGAKGQDVSAMSDPYKWIKSKEKTQEDADRAWALYKKRAEEGVNPILAFDCSGFVYWCQRQAGINVARRSAQGIYNSLCKHISEDELRAGDLIFHYNGKKIAHVGIYVGDGKTNECYGRDVGVVTTHRTYWNRYGRLKSIEDEYPDVPTERIVYVKGGSVNVRTGGSTEYRSVGVAHRGDNFPYIGVAKSGWYKIEYKGKTRYISCRSDLTEVRSV